MRTAITADAAVKLLLKTCVRCRRRKRMGEFYKNAKAADGLQSQCKQCNADIARERARADPEKNRQRVREWQAANPVKVRAKYQRRYQETIANYKSYRAFYQTRIKATRAVHAALASGVLVKQMCFMCGALRVDAHHASYAPEMWLCVTWLCRTHHKQLHLNFRLDGDNT